MRTSTITRAAALSTAVALILAGCGGGGRGGDDDTNSTPGVTDDTIVLGMTAPLTGPAAAYADAAKGVEAYFDSVNDKGGVNGRKIKLIVRDDAYDPAKTVSQTTRLVDTDKVFALVGGVGSAPQLSVYKDLNAKKVPNLLINSALDVFVDPVLPFVSITLPSTTTEQNNLITYARSEFKDAKIGILLQNDDVGHAMTDVWKGAYGADVVAAESFDTTDTDVSNQMGTLRKAGADVVVFLGTSKFTALGLLAMERDGWEVPRIAQSNAFDATVVKTAGKAADGVITTSALKPFDGDDPAIASALDIIAKHGKGLAPSQIALNGIANAMIMENILKDAGKDLTRESLMKAHDSLSISEPGPWWGTVELSADDHGALECQQLLRNDGGTFVTVGDVICP